VGRNLLAERKATVEQYRAMQADVDLSPRRQTVCRLIEPDSHDPSYARTFLSFHPSGVYDLAGLIRNERVCELLAARVDFQAIDRDMRRGLDAKTHSFAFYLDHLEANSSVDDDAFSDAA
jgi:hypothetical protein